MKKLIVMMSVMSAGLCFAGDFVPVRAVAPQEPVLLAMAIGVAGGNNLDNAGPTIVTCPKPKSQIVPKHQKNNYQNNSRKKQRINQPRKGY